MNLIPLFHISVISLIVLSLISDIKTYKIKNIIIFPFISLGLVINVISYRLCGALQSFAGALIPLVLLFLLYALRMLGSGDIKLFSAIGSIMGIKFVLYAIIYSFLSGGILAILLMLMRKNGKQRLLHLFTYLKSCYLTLSLLPYTDFENKNDGASFRFSYAVAFGMLTLYIMAFCGQVSGFSRF